MDINTYDEKNTVNTHITGDSTLGSVFGQAQFLALFRSSLVVSYRKLSNPPRPIFLPCAGQGRLGFKGVWFYANRGAKGKLSSSHSDLVARLKRLLRRYVFGKLSSPSARFLMA